MECLSGMRLQFFLTNGHFCLPVQRRVPQPDGGGGNGEGETGMGRWERLRWGDGEEEGKVEKSWQGPGVGRKGGGRRVDKKEWGGEGETGLGQ